MMKSKLVWFAFLTIGLLSFNAQAQEGNEIDSLKSRLKISSSSERFGVLLKLSDAYSNVDLGKAMSFAKQAMEAASQEEDSEGEVRARISFSKVLSQSGKTDSAKIVIDEAKRLCLETNDKKLEAKVLMQLANIFRLKSDYKSATELMLKSLGISDSLNENYDRGIKLMEIGGLYMHLKDWPSALKFYYQVVQEKSNDTKVLARVNYCIGIAYRKMEKYDLAVDSYLKALIYFENNGDISGQAKSLADIGRVYQQSSRCDRALDYYYRALDKSSGIDKALNANIHVWISSCNLKLNQIKAAESFGVKGLELAKELKLPNLIKDAHAVLSSIHESKGDWKKAFLHQQRFHLISDSLLNAESMQQINELKFKFDSERKEKELNTLLKEREVKRLSNAVILLIGVIVAACLLGGFSLYRKFVNRKISSLEKSSMNFEKKLSEAHNVIDELKREIGLKEQSISSFNVHLMQKNNLIEDLKSKIGALGTVQNGMAESELKNINKLMQQFNHVDNEWGDFRLTFDNVHSDFFHKIKLLYPEITASELKLCALIKMNINLKEAARILGLAVDSVKTARYRLRKKFGLSRDQNLMDFIMKIEIQNKISERMVVDL